MFDRDAEWAALARFTADELPGATLGVVSGRRQGKTFLLDALCRASEGFFFEATEAAGPESLMRIGAEIGEFTAAAFPPRPAARALRDRLTEVIGTLAKEAADL